MAIGTDLTIVHNREYNIIVNVIEINNRFKTKFGGVGCQRLKTVIFKIKTRAINVFLSIIFQLKCTCFVEIKYLKNKIYLCNVPIIPMPVFQVFQHLVKVVV